jgi:hypothetical protein
VSGRCAWKKQGRSRSLASGRTVNRNRSPRLKASGRQNNVGKGSRQTGSVTSGKGLAPRTRVGCRCNEIRVRNEGAVSGALGCCSRLPICSGRFACRAHYEVSAWNCYEQEESNWLIKPQHVASSQRWRVACDFCPVP